MSWFETTLPDGLHTIAEVVEEAVVGLASTGWEEFADDAGDVVAQAECFRIVYALALHAQAEPADARNDYRVAIGELHLQGMFQVCYHSHHRRAVISPCHQRFSYHVVQRHLALTHGLGKIFSIRAAALDVVFNQSDVYCHTILINCLIRCYLDEVLLILKASPALFKVKQLVLPQKELSFLRV